MLTQHVCISFFVEDDFWLGFHRLEFRIPYPPHRLWVVCLAYHHAGLSSPTKLALAGLNFGNESTGIVSEWAWVFERGLLCYFIAVCIVHTFPKCMQYFVWWFVRRLIAITVIFLCQALIRWSLMEIDRSINCLSPELNWSLGVNYHCPGLFSDCKDDTFGNPIRMMNVCRTWVVCRTASHEDISHSLMFVFLPSIISPKSIHLVSHRVYWGLKWLVAGGAGLGYLIWQQTYGCVPRVVIDA